MHICNAPNFHLPITISLFIHLFLFLSLFFTVPFLCFEGSKMADSKSIEENETSSNEKKYGGLVPKKKPLISKDHERAFFDSADWALCKQGAGVDQMSTVAIETLQPKLQRTPHQQLPPRRPGFTSGRDNLVSS